MTITIGNIKQFVAISIFLSIIIAGVATAAQNEEKNVESNAQPYLVATNATTGTISFDDLGNPKIIQDTFLAAVNTPEHYRTGMKERVLSMLAAEGIDTKRAERIIFCESSWNPYAINQNRNGSNDLGIWQLNSIHKIPDEVRVDPIASTEVAIKMIKKLGFQPWVCSRKV